MTAIKFHDVALVQEVFLRNNEVLIVIYLSLAVLKRRNRSREYFADTHGYSV